MMDRIQILSAKVTTYAFKINNNLNLAQELNLDPQLQL